MRTAKIANTAVELSKRDAAFGLLPLFARHERGEGRGEEEPNKNSPPLPLPFPATEEWKRGRRTAASFIFEFLNSIAAEGGLAEPSQLEASRERPGIGIREFFWCDMINDHNREGLA
jgi:hypothetical protein